MSRVVIVGIAGGGKSTLARRISAALSLPLHQMDKLSWLPGWVMSGNSYCDPFHDQIMLTDRWVIDGYGSWESVKRRCDQADTLILMDQAAWRHYWWAYKRNIKLLFKHNPDLPDGCSKWPLWKMMGRVVHQTRRTELQRLRKLLTDRPEKTQYVLRSPREITAFCREHLTPAGE